MPVAKSLGRYTIAHSHSVRRESSLKSNMTRLLRLPVRFMADGLFACSESAAEWMFGSKSGQAHIMNNAIDVESFACNETTRAQVRKELGLEDKFVLGHVGGFKRVKNHMFLIQVFKEVQKLRPDARLLLIGDGGLLNDVKDKVRQLGLEEFVQFAGVRADVSSLLSAMDVFVFPSLYEGVPVTLIEAQSAGLPCIISDTITNEVFVTELLEALSLSESAHVWAEKISRFSNGYDRKDTSNEIISAGYDIKQSVTELERFYLNSSGALITNNYT
jgi:glycosyltransferase involved in cell wall biosynthesis